MLCEWIFWGSGNASKFDGDWEYPGIEEEISRMTFYN
jgi:hypothetical protein